MPWPTRSSRLAALANSNISAAITSVYTTPATNTDLLKEWRVFNFSGTSRAFALWVAIDGVWVLIGHLASLPPSTMGGESQRNCVIHGGESVGLSSSSAGDTGLYIAGARLGP